MAPSGRTTSAEGWTEVVQTASVSLRHTDMNALIPFTEIDEEPRVLDTNIAEALVS
jgi:hypothetical protein